MQVPKVSVIDRCSCTIKIVLKILLTYIDSGRASGCISQVYS